MVRGKTTLYKYKNLKTRPKTIIFAGNGIFKNGWTILDNVIEENIEGNREYLPDREMFLLRNVEQFRFLVNERVGLNQAVRHRILREEVPRQEWPSEIIQLRQLVANAYCDGCLEFRNIPAYVAERLRNEQTFVITSNWDHMLWNSQDNICQIHGRCEFPESLIFPTEYVRDTPAFYHQLLTEDAFIDHFDTELIRFLHQRQERLLQAENEAQSWFHKDVEEIVFWGIGLHLYDVEIINMLTLADVIFSVNREKVKIKITVVNPDKDRKVLRRTLSIFKNIFSIGAQLFHLDPDIDLNGEPRPM